MNSSFNLLKNLKKDFLKNKKFLLSIPTFIAFKYLFTYEKKAYCYAENNNTNEPNANDFDDIYSELNEEDLAEMGVSKEAMSEEEMMMLKQQTQQSQVTSSFNYPKINQNFHSPNEDKWNGLRFTLEWKPTKMFYLEYAASASSLKQHNYRLSCFSVLPNKTDPQIANVFVGRIEDNKSLFIRQNYIIGHRDKIEISSQWPKNDAYSGINVFEYNKKFDRCDLTLKLSPMENSFSILSTAYKNLFVGMEIIQDQAMQFKHKYAFHYKYNKNLSCCAIFNDKFTDLSLYSEFKVNKNWKMLLNYSKTEDVFMKNMGMGLDFNFSNCFKYGKNTDFGFDINHLFKIHALYTYRLNKMIDLQANLDVGPINKAKFNKDLLKGLGFGIKFQFDRFDELASLLNEQFEEDLSEYQMN